MRLNHLHLHVSDQARSQRFYEEQFGFREDRRFDDVVFLRDEAGFDLALVPEVEPAPPPAWFHFGFRLPGRADVEACYRRLTALSAVTIYEDLTDEGDFVWFRCADPDGYVIEVYWE